MPALFFFKDPALFAISILLFNPNTVKKDFDEYSCRVFFCWSTYKLFLVRIGFWREQPYYKLGICIVYMYTVYIINKLKPSSELIMNYDN